MKIKNTPIVIPAGHDSSCPASYALFVTAHPLRDADGALALDTAKRLIAQKQTLLGVFFYLDGVYTAHPPEEMIPPTPCLGQAWQDLSEENGLPLFVCTGSLAKRGVDTDRLFLRFVVSGLGVWMEWMQKADHVLHFASTRL